MVICRRHYLFLVEECCIGDGMDIFELLAIMCGMMLGTVAIIIIIGLVIGSIKWTHTKCYCWWLLLQLLPWTYTGRWKNEMAWFLFPDRCDCSYHDRADSIGERMNAIDIMLIVCTVALFIIMVIINVWQWFPDYGFMHVNSRYCYLRLNKVENMREADFIFIVLAIVLITWALTIM